MPKGPVAPGSVIGGSTPVEGEEVVASVLGDIASGLGGRPESAPDVVDASGVFGVEASEDGVGGGLFEVPPDDPPAPLLDEPDELDDPEEPEEFAVATPELPAPVPGIEPDEGEADAPDLGAPFPHAAMTIATPKHDIPLARTVSITLYGLGAKRVIRHEICLVRAGERPSREGVDLDSLGAHSDG